VGGTLGDRPSSLGGASAPGDLVASQAAVAELLVEPDIDLGLTLCGIAIARPGEAAGARPEAPAPRTPTRVLDISGLGAVDLAAPLTRRRSATAPATTDTHPDRTWPGETPAPGPAPAITDAPRPEPHPARHQPTITTPPTPTPGRTTPGAAPAHDHGTTDTHPARA
jgi:hypothetical protein